MVLHMRWLENEHIRMSRPLLVGKDEKEKEREKEEKKDKDKDKDRTGSSKKVEDKMLHMLSEAMHRLHKTGVYALKKGYPGTLTEERLNEALSEVADLQPGVACTEVDVRVVQINRIPSSLSRFDAEMLQRINLNFDQLEGEEQSIARTCNPTVIIRYLKALKKGTKFPFRQVKVIVMGAANAGKTTLVRAMNGVAYSAKSLSTDGIEISTLDLRGCKVHIYDFAGQHVYRYLPAMSHHSSKHN